MWEYADAAELEEKSPYDCEIDIQWLTGSGQKIAMKPDMFYIVYPTDAHKPCCPREPEDFIQKAVVKIRIDRLLHGVSDRQVPCKGDEAMDVKIDEIVKQVIAEVKTGGKDCAASIGKGACLTEPEHYELRDFDLPVPGPKEILVRVEGCIVSREDADEFLKGIPGYQCPVIEKKGRGQSYAPAER